MSSLPSVKYAQHNSLIVNANENIDELNWKIIPNCTLKHSNQKENVLIPIRSERTRLQLIKL
jgi:hypothetical protein